MSLRRAPEGAGPQGLPPSTFLFLPIQLSNSSVFRKTRRSSKTWALQPHNLSGRTSVAPMYYRRWAHPRNSRRSVPRGRVSSSAVDGRCIAPASFGCQQPIQKKFEKLHFPRISGLLQRTNPSRAAAALEKNRAPNLGHDRRAWSEAYRRVRSGRRQGSFARAAVLGRSGRLKTIGRT